jgi:hypothetical protein
MGVLPHSTKRPTFTYCKRRSRISPLRIREGPAERHCCPLLPIAVVRLHSVAPDERAGTLWKDPAYPFPSKVLPGWLNAALHAKA